MNMFEKEMKWKPFLILNAIGAILLASWFVPFTRGIWDQIDLVSFRYLNSSLEASPFWQTFWAAANARAADFYAALFVGLFFFIYILDAKKEERPIRYAQLALLALWGEIGILITKQSLDIIFEYIQFARPSCTAILENTVRVSETMPWLKIKDVARSCFPSTHAEVLFKWLLFVGFFCGRRYFALASAWGLFFLFPRLVAGAHWVSDAVAGSLPIALTLFSLAVYTPLYGICMNFFLNLTNKILDKFPIFYFERIKENAL